jgi:SAM-dependent methyltransferase
MSNLFALDPTGRFTGVAGLYARCRPDYPGKAVDFILKHACLKAGSVLVDVGCGTGISSRLFARRGLRVIGVEPNAEMRLQAEAEPAPGGGPAPQYRAGRAEATGLPDATADAVLAAQAFHWFEPAAALREFHRILKPGGWVALVWNEPEDADPFTAAYAAAVHTPPEAAAVVDTRATAGDALLRSAWFERGERVAFGHGQTLDEEGVLGRAFSASYAPREPAAADALAAALRQAFRTYQRDGRAVLRYQTFLYIARRHDRPPR